MDMTGAARSPFRQFVHTWRRELIRGGVMFGLVVVVGLAVSRVSVNAGVPWDALGLLQGFDIDHDGDAFGGGREVGDRWEWRGSVTTTQQVWIRNTNGPIQVVAGTGDVLEVISEKSWRRSDPGDVEMVVIPSARGVTICALWPSRDGECADGGEYRQSHVRRNDVAVRFTVKLPRGVPLDVQTINGEVSIDGASGAITAETVNGPVHLGAASGPAKVSTVNGSIDAAMRALPSGDIELETVNGSISVRLPDHPNAVLDAETVNGKVETEFPVQLSGKISPRRVRGTLGSGGTILRLNTVNGSIRVRHLPADVEVTPAPDATKRSVRVVRVPPVPTAAPRTPTP